MERLYILYYIPAQSASGQGNATGFDSSVGTVKTAQRKQGADLQSLSCARNGRYAVLYISSDAWPNNGRILSKKNIQARRYIIYVIMHAYISCESR